jgi:hypothetical protein
MAKKIKLTPFEQIYEYVNNYVQYLNNSKIFAGLMIIILNIASKFVNIKIGKTLEAYLKYSFSKQILVFAIAWIGTRDIYVALLITIVFVLITQFLLHEDSSFFILSEETKEHYCNLLDNPPDIVTAEDIKKAKEILEKAEKQKAEGVGEADANMNSRAENTSYDSFYKSS